MMSLVFSIAKLFHGDLAAVSWMASYLVDDHRQDFTPSDMCRSSSGLLNIDIALAVVRLLKDRGIAQPIDDSLDPTDVRYKVNKEKVALVLGQTLMVSPVFPTELSADSIHTTVRLVATPPRRIRPYGRLLTELTTLIAPLWGSLRGLIDRAEKSVVIINPFFDEEGINEWRLALEDALKRGVEVFIITRYLSAPNDRNLSYIKKLGIPRHLLHLFEFAPDRAWAGVHAKVVIVDGSEAYVGSANATLSSIAEVLEVGVILSGAEANKLSKLADIVLRTSVIEVSV